jgi:hypothetical protein
MISDYSNVAAIEAKHFVPNGTFSDRAILGHRFACPWLFYFTLSA